ncbi:MAG TPA: tetratricopeptide repeat protein [Chitinophagaceae bacterium]|jgi:predicted Zn-dependent protease|nr:tetratricopeptide repeat protein [Chitinophagaceae bacterium]
MKKKITATILAIGFLSVPGLKAQTIQEGMNHLYADRFKSAIGIFEKLLATNPNNIEATYWLGQVYFDMDDNVRARQLYEKALASNGSAPLILVGLGHADLHDNKTNDARQKFEAAITAATNGRKGVDPTVLTAIGRANVDAKAGDAVYAVQKLEAADQKNTETLLQLGNAYRKANPGQGGGQAFETYKKALAVNPAFAVANLRLAKLFESQKNWEFVLQYLNDALKSDSKFAPAYYELFYYNFFRSKFPEAEGHLSNYIANSDPDIQHEYLYAQLCWARKDFPCAITKAESVVASTGDKTKPKVYKLLADAYYQKGESMKTAGDSIGAMKEYVNAKNYINKYFQKEKVEDQIANDYKLLANILGRTGGTTEEVFNAYVKGAPLDSVISSRIDYIKEGAAYFKANKIRDKEGDLIQMIIDLKPKPTINDYFDLTLARYFSLDYARSRDVAVVMIDKFPDQVYGYEWAFNNSRLSDTTKKDSIAVPDAIKLFDFANKDTAKFKKQYISAASFLAIYYANDAKDKEKAIDYLKKWQLVDVANAENIQRNIDILMKAPAKPPVKSTGKTSFPASKASASKPEVKKKVTEQTKTMELTS